MNRQPDHEPPSAFTQLVHNGNEITGVPYSKKRKLKGKKTYSKMAMLYRIFLGISGVFALTLVFVNMKSMQNMDMNGMHAALQNLDMNGMHAALQSFASSPETILEKPVGIAEDKGITTASDSKQETSTTTMISNNNNNKNNLEKPVGIAEDKAITTASDSKQQASTTTMISNNNNNNNKRRILKAHLERPFTDEEWNSTPLPVRTSQPFDLKTVEYPELTSCSNLPAQFPIDNSPCEVDPYLPWIHDVFPSHDGSKIQFIAQNKRRCNTGEAFADVKKFFQPQAALFQHVPIKRVEMNNKMRYKLVPTHAEADEDGIETRFICRFSATGEETLSKHNVNYDYHTIRKRYAATFTEEGFDVHMIWSSQLLFYCPVPEGLQQKIKSGETVLNDYATMYVDLIPIRTKPRYGNPSEFIPPKYGGLKAFPYKYNATQEWGKDHVLPEIENSGRWENVPICRPPMLEKQLELKAEKDQQSNEMQTLTDTTMESSQSSSKPHKLVACTWTSIGYKTRGDAAVISDGPERLYQWIVYHLLIGYDHIYVYDNTGRLLDDKDKDDPSATLAHITNQFPPSSVTRIDWPATICNNGRANSKNKGERSSQYAAESSCRLRYGDHTDWMSNLDTDEYLVPMNHTNVSMNGFRPLLEDMDEKNEKILTFPSKRAMPRYDMIAEPNIENGYEFAPKKGVSFLQTYNCQKEKLPRTNFVPAEKQIYRPDYILMHFVHYSTITIESQLSIEQSKQIGFPQREMYKEHHHRLANEVTEGLMVHAKKVTNLESAHRNWKNKCANFGCHLGFPFPDITPINDTLVRNKEGYIYNCYVIDHVEKWIPELDRALTEMESNKN